MSLIKYPRTRHIEGSRLQPGDEDLDSVPFSAIEGRFAVVEEKMDGANSAISFDEDGQLKLQSRGHFLTGGPREIHFNLFKRWANAHADALRKILQHRYIAYGEWVYAKHTMFYDLLPHYWLEFDVFDREQQVFLSTKERSAFYAGAPVLAVPVLFRGELKSLPQLTKLLGRSTCISDAHMDRLRSVCIESGFDAERVVQETDYGTEMEGLYIKVEEDGIVRERYKFVRSSFLTRVLQSGSHWLNRPIVPNQLQPGVNLFCQDSE